MFTCKQGFKNGGLAEGASAGSDAAQKTNHQRLHLGAVRKFACMQATWKEHHRRGVQVRRGRNMEA